MRTLILCCLVTAAAWGAQSEMEKARDRQDSAALEKMASEAEASAQRSPKDAEAQYRAALTYSYLAEVFVEQRDKAHGKRAAEAGIQAAERAVALAPTNAEYNRILGSLLGQAIAGGNLFTGLSYGKRAQDSIAKALQLDPKSSKAHMSEGVGNYYMPTEFGGGPEKAIKSFNDAVALDPKNADAYLWLGLALRKAHRNKEARDAISKSLALNPNQIWAKQQLEKTPAQ